MAGSDMLSTAWPTWSTTTNRPPRTGPRGQLHRPLAHHGRGADGLAFTRGAAGRQHELTIENLSAGDVTVSLQLVEPTGDGVALYLTDPVPEGPQS